jgi:hypothetical protein
LVASSCHRVFGLIQTAQHARCGAGKRPSISE